MCKIMDKKERILGQDKGCLPEDIFDYLNTLLEKDPKRAEVVVYLLYDSCNQFRHDYNCNKVTHTKEMKDHLENVEYARFYLIGWTKHFGVIFDPQDGKGEIYLSDSFERWFRFWNDHFNRIGAKWKEFNYAVSHDEDITPYLPEKAWNED